jgi:hypothetical protein
MYDEDESIYNVIPQSQQAAARAKRYHSKHNHTVPPSFSTFGFQGTSKVIGNVAGEKEEKHDGTHPSKKPAGTFGRTVSTTVNPKQFLRKTEGVRDTTKEKFEHKHEIVKPPIPSRSDRPVMGLSTDKNFVVANAVEAILAAPKKVVEEEARAVDKGGYGKVPAYIQRVKRELSTRKEYSTKALLSAAEQAADNELHELSPEEVEELRAGLKARYTQVQKQFATLSFALETASQLRSKEMLEKQLTQLEQAMAKLNKRHVFVCPE